MSTHLDPKHFTPGQEVTYGGFTGTIVRHYHGGLWEVRLPGGVTCVSGAYLRKTVKQEV